MNYTLNQINLICQLLINNQRVLLKDTEFKLYFKNWVVDRQKLDHDFKNNTKIDNENILIESCLKIIENKKWFCLFLNDSTIDNNLDFNNINKILYCQCLNAYPEIMSFDCFDSFDQEQFIIQDIYEPFEMILQSLNDLPVLLIWNYQEVKIISIKSKEQLLFIYHKLSLSQSLKELDIDNYPKSEIAYFIQLSDLHIGNKGLIKGKKRLLEALDIKMKQIKPTKNIKFIITGDIMNSPNRKNMYLASEFLEILRQRYQSQVYFILGNHDMMSYGFNLMRRPKSKVIAYLLRENIKVLEDINIILIKMNSNMAGNLARGKIGERQLSEIDYELSLIDNLEKYTLMVLIHHHLLPVKKASFLNLKWNENQLVSNLVDRTKALSDSKEVLKWIKNRKIKYVFHGHKHIPAINKSNKTYLMGAGSSTGVVKDKSGSYLSYNLIKYNMRLKEIESCAIYYEEIENKKRKHVHLFKF